MTLFEQFVWSIKEKHNDHEWLMYWLSVIPERDARRMSVRLRAALRDQPNAALQQFLYALRLLHVDICSLGPKEEKQVQQLFKSVGVKESRDAGP
jgi:hypothetical protein